MSAPFSTAGSIRVPAVAYRTKIMAIEFRNYGNYDDGIILNKMLLISNPDPLVLEFIGCWRRLSSLRLAYPQGNTIQLDERVPFQGIIDVYVNPTRRECELHYEFSGISKYQLLLEIRKETIYEPAVIGVVPHIPAQTVENTIQDVRVRGLFE